MCTGMELMAIGQGVQGLSSAMAGEANSEFARAEGASKMDAARVQARNILRETERRRSSARAATAASGARIDEFSLGNEQEIIQAGETDAALTILSGEQAQRAKAIEARMEKARGYGAAAGSLFQAASSTGNWRGVKTRTNDIPGVNRSNAYEQWLRYGVSGD